MREYKRHKGRTICVLESGVEHRIVSSKREMCCRENDYICTRPKGHKESHVACGKVNHNLIVWEQEPKEPTYEFARPADKL